MLNAMIDVLFPPRCFGCSIHLLATEHADRCCGACANTVHLVESPRCPQCALPRQVPTGVDELCAYCLSSRPPFDATWARWVYDGAVSDAIRRAKTSDDPSSLFALLDADRPWFEAITEELAEARWTTPPMHPRDLVRRGWDPARMAGRRVISARFTDPLRKTRRSVKQAQLGRDARQRALRGAFECAERVDGDWVVFDDVMTTGATLAEAARALKAGGARRVFGVVIARSV